MLTNTRMGWWGSRQGGEPLFVLLMQHLLSEKSPLGRLQRRLLLSSPLRGPLWKQGSKRHQSTRLLMAVARWRWRGSRWQDHNKASVLRLRHPGQGFEQQWARGGHLRWISYKGLFPFFFSIFSSLSFLLFNKPPFINNWSQLFIEFLRVFSVPRLWMCHYDSSLFSSQILSCKFETTGTFSKRRKNHLSKWTSSVH